MKKSNFVMVVAAVMLTLTATCAFALMSEEEQEVLRGLERVHFVVERLKPEIELDGLYRSTLESDAELMLRIVGIKVLSEEESLQTPGTPNLCLKVNALKCSNGYVYNIGLSLEEKATLLRKNIQIPTTVLKMPDQLGIAPRLSDIRDEVKDLIEEFIRAWHAVNQK